MHHKSVGAFGDIERRSNRQAQYRSAMKKVKKITINLSQERKGDSTKLDTSQIQTEKDTLNFSQNIDIDQTQIIIKESPQRKINSSKQSP